MDSNYQETLMSTIAPLQLPSFITPNSVIDDSVIDSCLSELQVNYFWQLSTYIGSFFETKYQDNYLKSKVCKLIFSESTSYSDVIEKTINLMSQLIQRPSLEIGNTFASEIISSLEDSTDTSSLLLEIVKSKFFSKSTKLKSVKYLLDASQNVLSKDKKSGFKGMGYLYVNISLLNASLKLMDEQTALDVLVLAAAAGNIEAVRLIAENKLDLLSLENNRYFQKAIRLAIQQGKHQVVKFFLNAGISPNLKIEESDMTLLMASVANYNALEMFQLNCKLFEENIDRGISTTDLFETIPLTKVSKDKVTQLLIDRKADVNKVNKNRQTALHLAVKYNKAFAKTGYDLRHYSDITNFDAICMLIRANANPYAKDFNDETIIKYVQKNEFSEILKKLEECNLFNNDLSELYSEEYNVTTKNLYTKLESLRDKTIAEEIQHPLKKKKILNS